VCVCVLHHVFAEHRFSAYTDGKNICATLVVCPSCVPEKVGKNQKDVNKK